MPGRRLTRRAFLSTSTTFLCAATALTACAGSAAPASPPAASSKPSGGAADVTAKPSAAGSVAASPATAKPSPLAHVKGVWIGLTANQMLWPLAKDAGYFEKYGVNFDLQYIQGSAPAVASAVSGEVQMIPIAGSVVATAQAAKQDLVMVAGFQNEAGWKILTGQGVNTVADLKGKSVAVTNVGQSDYFAWTILAKQQGWKPEDFKYVNSKDAPGQVTMLQAGNAQAVALSPPNEVLAQRAGAHVVLDMSQLHSPLQQAGMVVQRSYLDKNHEVTLNVLKATVDAIHRWKTDPDFTKAAIKKWLKEDDPAFIDSAYNSYVEVFPRVPYPSKEGFTETISEVATQAPDVKNLTAEQCMDTTLVKELEDSGFITQVYGS